MQLYKLINSYRSIISCNIQNNAQLCTQHLSGFLKQIITSINQHAIFAVIKIKLPNIRI